MARSSSAAGSASASEPLVDQGLLELVTGFQIDALGHSPAGSAAQPRRELGPFDEIIAATGARPDMTLLRELRLDLDEGVEAPRALAPLIDPNRHSCGTVRRMAQCELAHPDPNVFIVGAKSYGRAPTFLLLTGYEQVRSVIAAIQGDWDSARDVHLELPAMGVFNRDLLDDSPAGGASVQAATGAPARVSGCCR